MVGGTQQIKNWRHKGLAQCTVRYLPTGKPPVMMIKRIWGAFTTSSCIWIVQKTEDYDFTFQRNYSSNERAKFPRNYLRNERAKIRSDMYTVWDICRLS